MPLLPIFPWSKAPRFQMQARKLNAVCGRWKSPVQANNNPANTVMFVTLTENPPRKCLEA